MKDSIFVSIASYRDDVCNSTLMNLFEMAEKPEKVYVGICQQNKDEDEDCVGKYNNRNVRIKRISYKEAKGPTYARYLCSELYKDEEYYFQIDSHSKFVKNWDTKLILMIEELKSKGVKKPVLSHYPLSMDLYNSDKTEEVSRICKPFINSRDMISFMASEVIDTKGEYYLTPFAAGGMIFCESSFLKELPYDPELPYIFVGEEILHSIRFYTNGWDIYTPKENIVYHEYTRSEKPKIWTDNPYYSDMEAFNKVRYLIGLDKTDEKLTDNMKKSLKYGLGTVRTLDDYYNLCGIEIDSRKVSKNFCRENNEASEDDIFKSNEKNWTQETYEETTNEKDYDVKENYNRKKKCKNKFDLVFFVLICIFILVLMIFFNINI
jgi:hypothetical protein